MYGSGETDVRLVVMGKDVTIMPQTEMIAWGWVEGKSGMVEPVGGSTERHDVLMARVMTK